MTPVQIKSPKRVKPLHILAHIILISGGLLTAYPIIFMILVGFMSESEFNTTVLGFLPIPHHWTLFNYESVFAGGSGLPLGKYVENSLIRTIYSTGAAVLTAFLTGYAFARLRFKGRNKLFLFLLGTVMIPGTVGLIPTFIEYARWPFTGGNNIFYGGHGIYDSFWVYLIGGPSINILGMFLVKQSLEGLPVEIEEAADIDGAGLFRRIFTIVMPLQKPVLAYIAITTAIGVWNDWMTPFFFTTSDRLQTMASAMGRMTSAIVGSENLPNYPLMILLGLWITVPCLIIFFIFQKYFVQGLANAGLKG